MIRNTNKRHAGSIPATATAARLIITLLCLLGFTSCENETGSPISLEGITGSSISLPYPYGQKNCSIQGGDGQYSVMCDSPDIVHAAMVSAVDMQLKALAVGDAVVRVSDKSGHILELQIHVDYDRRTQVNHREVVVRGDLTNEEMEVIRAEALPTIPVKVGGGYLFFPYAWADSGTVMIYPDEFGNNGVESLFEMKRIPWVSPDGMEGQSPACCISINGEERTFFIVSQSGYFTFCEDLTDRFKSGYPKLEQVYTQQVFTRLYR